MNILRTILLTALTAVVVACSSTDKKPSGISPLPYNAINLSGDLYFRTMKNFDRLEEEKYRPENIFLTEAQSGNWPGDTEGRTILGLVLDAQATGRTPLYLEQIIDKLPQKLNEKGYMGPIYTPRANEQQISGNGWMLRGLCEYYEWKGDEKVLGYIKSIANLFVEIKDLYESYNTTVGERDNSQGGVSGSIGQEMDKWMLSTDIGCIFIGMEGLIHAYKILQTDEIKESIEILIDKFVQMDILGIQAQTHSTLTALRGLIRYAEITGDYSYIEKVKEFWNIYTSEGMTEHHANYNWFHRYDKWTEPCAIIDSYMVAVQLWQHTGEFKYRNDAELIYYNAMLHAQRANGGFGCDNCPGEGAKTPAIAVKFDEAHWCCTMRGGEGLSCANRYSAFTDGAESIWFPFYHQGEFDIKLGRGNIKIAEMTKYPYTSSVKFVVEENNAGNCTLYLPLPYWMSEVTATLNGRNIRANEKDNFFKIEQNFQKGDCIELTFSMPLRSEQTINKANTKPTDKKFYCGPLLLAAETTADLSDATPVDFKLLDNCNFIHKSGTILTPLAHNLDPLVKRGSYARQILF